MSNKREGKKINHKIKYYRKKRGYTQKELAKKMGVSQQLISAIETDLVLPNPTQINDLLRSFGNITFDELFQTGRLSICISEANEVELDKYICEIEDVFPKNISEFEKKSILVNYLLKLFLEDKLELSKDEVADKILREMT